MAWDEAVLHFINEGLANPVLDVTMLAVSIAGLTYIWFAWAIPLWMAGRKREALDLLLLIVLADVFTFLIKYAVGRPRPTDVRTVSTPLDDFSSDFSFPSGHATRAFAASLFLSLKLRRYTIPLFLYSTLIAFSRIYVGAHFPTDVLAGALLGLTLGGLTLRVCRMDWYMKKRDWLMKKILGTRGEPRDESPP